MIFFKDYLFVCYSYVIFYVKLTKSAEQLAILKIVVNSIKKSRGKWKDKKSYLNKTNNLIKY